MSRTEVPPPYGPRCANHVSADGSCEFTSSTGSSANARSVCHVLSTSTYEGPPALAPNVDRRAISSSSASTLRMPRKLRTRTSIAADPPKHYCFARVRAARHRRHAAFLLDDQPFDDPIDLSG